MVDFRALAVRARIVVHSWVRWLSGSLLPEIPAFDISGDSITVSAAAEVLHRGKNEAIRRALGTAICREAKTEARAELIVVAPIRPRFEF